MHNNCINMCRLTNAVMNIIRSGISGCFIVCTFMTTCLTDKTLKSKEKYVIIVNMRL